MQVNACEARMQVAVHLAVSTNLSLFCLAGFAHFVVASTIPVYLVLRLYYFCALESYLSNNYISEGICKM